MKQILLTLEAGSREERAALVEEASLSTETTKAPSFEDEQPIVISGSLTVAP